MLRSISEANNLKLKLTQVLKRSPCRTKEDQRCFQRELSRLFTSLTIPPAIAAELIRAYHQYLQGGHAHIVPSSPPSKTYPSGQSNVYGDANVIESILEVWANIVATTVQHGGYNLPMHTLLLQSPILVEYAPAAEASGFAYTKNPATGSKTEVAIAGAWGVYHPNLENLDTITVDIRTWNVINRQPATKTQEYVRGNETLKQQSVAAAKQKQLVLSDTEAVQLARGSIQTEATIPRSTKSTGCSLAGKFMSPASNRFWNSATNPPGKPLPAGNLTDPTPAHYQAAGLGRQQCQSRRTNSRRS